MSDRADETSPLVRMIEREGIDPGDADAELARRLKRSASDPFIAMARMIIAVEREKADSGEQLQAQLGEAIKAHDAKVTALETKVTTLEIDNHDLKRTASTGHRIVWGALAASIAVLTYVIDHIWTGAERTGQMETKILYIEKAIDRIDRPPAPPALTLTPPPAVPKAP